MPVQIFFLCCIIVLYNGCLAQETSDVLGDDLHLKKLVYQLQDQFATVNLKFDMEKQAFKDRYDTVSKKLEESENKIQVLQNNLQGKRISSVYTRWGRTRCDGPNAELVYKGYVGMAHHGHSGGGANFICLIDSPTWEYSRMEARHDNYGSILGAEYETGDTNWPFRFSGSLANHDATCAVCEVEGHSSSLMIPGTHYCPGGWSRQYKGYIVAEHRNAKSPAEFICMDKEPEAVPGGSSDRVEGHIHFTKAFCGVLSCPPYKDNREITCVVCTK